MAQGVPLVSYILVNWRTEELLPRALNSIEAQDHGIREVILVDNGSPNFDEGLLAEFESVRLLRNSANRGFAAANNQALAECEGDFIVLLNCDAQLDPRFTRAALRVFFANPRIGTVVPKILLDYGSGRLDTTGHVMHHDRTAAQRGHGERDQGQYDSGGFVFGGTAAAVAYRRTMLDELADGGRLAEGGRLFDEDFFAYYEDVDLDWRAHLAGWRAYYEPDALAWHRGHGSGGRRSLAIRLRAEKNRYLMLAKNDSGPALLAHCWPLILYEGWHLLATLLRPWLWPAYFMLLTCLPRAWAKRRAAAAHWQRSPLEVAAGFQPRAPLPPPRAEPPAPERGLLETDAEAAVLAENLAASGQRGADELFPLVSVVVVSYNGLKLTKRCLAALRDQTYQALELIVVDNGSEVDEADLLATADPRLRTLRLEHNQGFSGGVNWGVSLARGEYIVLINNDALPDPDCVRNLVYALRRSGAAAVSGRLVDVAREADLAPTLAAIEAELDSGEQYVGGLPPAVTQALADSHLNHGLSLFGYIVPGAYGDEQSCFYPSGGLCAFPREAVADLLPELTPQRYFAYHEDAWLGLMLRGGGGRIAKEPRAAAAHLAGATARGLGRPRLRFLMERNRCLNLLGCYPTGVLWKLKPLNLLLDLLTVLTLLFTRPLDLLGWLGARLWVLTHPVEITRWRRRCRAALTVPDRDWLSELSGRLRGTGGWLNRLCLGWCRLTGIPCRESRHS